MRVKIVVINKGEAGESCEVYEHQGNEIKIELAEQEEPDVGLVFPKIDETATIGS